MTDYKNEYQKFADRATKDRASEEGFGRLRLGVFWGVAGPLVMGGMYLSKLFMPPPRWLAMGIVATAPLAIVLLIINYIRMPNDSKLSPTTLMICLITLIGAAANIAVASYLDFFKIISP